jgi:hypothetical protein
VPIEAQFGDAVTLEGYVFTRPDAQSACVRLRWHVRQAPANDFTVMLHVLDDAGNLLTTSDAPPLGGLYASLDWTPGQTLDDEHCFTMPGKATQVALGLYDSVALDRQPLTLEQAQPALTVQDNALYLPLSAEAAR